MVHGWPDSHEVWDLVADRLHAEGYGPDEPVIDDTTDEARGKNRRVEFVVEQE